MRDHPYSHLIRYLGDKKYFSLPDLDAARLKTLPYCTRILLEAAVRTCDNFEVTPEDVERLLNWKEHNRKGDEIAFKPSRVLLQDFTGVPCLVDLAAMRDAMSALGSDPMRVNPLIPTDLVIDHSVSVDAYHKAAAREINEAIEFERNSERFSFLKWGQQAFENMSVVPPGSGIVHQVNLEYLARVVFTEGDTLYPDSVVGTDSHTTMIAGLGVLGWGVGGIEAEATMMGQPNYMVVPDVVGFELSGKLPSLVTATDLVLKVAQMLREYKVVGKLVEFYGKGVAELSVADRATISNMSPEFGATAAFFPCDEKTISYLAFTGRPLERLALIEKYLRVNRLFRLYDEDDDLIEYRGKGLSLDLATIVPALAGPKRPHDYLPVAQVKSKFQEYLSSPVAFRGFGLDPSTLDKECTLTYGSQEYKLTHGSVVLAAITSCTNTSNPSVMIGAGLLAQKAVAAGLKPLPFVKCSLSPGSHVVYEYLVKAGLRDSLEKLNFYVTGFGCQTCIGNSGDLPLEVSEAIVVNDLVVTGVLSGNRNFEGRIHPLTRANFLASPPLVVAYALAGTVKIDFETEPVGIAADGRAVMLKDIWPDDAEIQKLVAECVTPDLFSKVYSHILQGSENWRATKVPEGRMYQWDDNSTYVHKPPFFAGMKIDPEPLRMVELAYCLLNLGDSITTDHISPAGKIALDSSAADYLRSKGVKAEAFNSYGSRRGNDEVMVRGTFANIRLVNKMVDKTGPKSLHIPSQKEMAIFDVAKMYQEGGFDTVIIAGAEYGSGSSRDWAAKGPLLYGVRAVIAKSFERIHRSNLVGMGILPLQFHDNDSATSLGLSGKLERFSIDTTSVDVQGDVTVKVYDLEGSQMLKSFVAKSRIDTAVELEYFKHGGILKYVLRKMAKARND